MEYEKEPKLYELMYIAKAADEAAALELAASAGAAIEKEKGMIAVQAQPSLKPLSFPIGGEVEAWQGWIKFMAKPEAINPIKEKIAHEPRIMRSSVFKIKKEEMSERFPRRRRIAAEPVSQAKKTDIEQIDKKLEEILGS
ncbi:MAG: 30S ribosomal protein S6 [Candidatus Niyogibacteria bacterium]|nr:30S ribosomal protein S6 [Candidatus Niyogibacteria bacterium]